MLTRKNIIWLVVLALLGIIYFSSADKDGKQLFSTSGLNQVVENAEIGTKIGGLLKIAPEVQKKTITLAGGCFWCIESAFQEELGVIDAISGYSGGSADDANYLAVSKGETDHREVVQVTYDANIISTEEVINIFWGSIDPTDGDGQFADRGFQYTTAIYYHDDEQKEVVTESKIDLNNSELLEGEVVTNIIPFDSFYPAEDYHQDYYKKSSEHYKLYEEASGRKGFVEETWAREAAIEFFENSEPVKHSDLVKGDYDYTDEEIELLLENLDPLAYHVVAENGTEQPFNNTYWDNKAAGIYVDVVTGEALFSSTHKYDSGTGWPAFWRSIDDESVELLDDNSLSITRTEVRSDTGHLGHVFDDGPIEKGGRRFCINSASLLFIPLDEMEEKGYGEWLGLFEE
ncbi:MAG: peptide methionine sulfoxide reductase msrA/msrB [Candidatus Paceibacteria bacterium]|jgi:peptide methionine sulfoxide reductase msrA/msrB